jgi:hypothetical protein
MGAMTLSVMAAALAVLAVVLFLLAAQSRKRIGIPAGALVYQDLSGQPFDGKPLRSHALGISGKPDCLIRTVAGIVPVELKNASKPPARGEVYPSHICCGRSAIRPPSIRTATRRTLIRRELRATGLTVFRWTRPAQSTRR